MEKINEKTKMFLLLAGISFQLLPEMLQAVLLYATRRSLGDFQMAVCGVIGIVLGTGCFFGAFALQFREEGIKNRGVFLRFLLGMLPVLCYTILDHMVKTYLFPVLAEKWFERLELLLLVMGAISLLFLALEGYACYAWVEGVRSRSLLHPVAEFLRHPFCGLGILLMLGLSEAAPALLSYLIQFLPGQNTYALSSLLQQGAAGILTGLLWILVFYLILVSFSGQKGKTEERGLWPTGKELVFTIAFAVVLAVLLVFQVMGKRQDPVEQVCEEIEEDLKASGLALIRGDVEGSVRSLQRACSVREVFCAALELGEGKSLEELAAEDPDNRLAEYFYCLKQQAPERMEERLRTAGRSPEYGLALLDLYGEMEELTESQQAYREEILSLCVGAGVYQNPYIRPEQMENKKERLKFRLKDYAGLEEQAALMEQAAAMMREGDMTQELVDQALSLAGEYPGNWTAQYLAAMAGSSLTYDEAGHYDRTVEAAAQYGRLYQEAFDLTEEEQCGLELTVADMMVKCYAWEEALPYLEDVIQKGGLEEAFPMASMCYEMLGEHEKTYELCMQMLEAEPGHVTARYYAAVNALKQGNVEDSLRQTVELARLAKESRDDAAYTADGALYAVLQMLAFNDDSRYTGYQYAVYDKLTKEQRKTVEQEPFLADYLDAVYECFASKEEGHKEKALSLTEKVLQENDRLPQAWYLKGTILFHMESYQEAVEAYQRSLALQEGTPAVWYALANAYDGLEEYEPAYEACRRALALLPQQDHGSDWYGISYHCGNLMKALEEKLGRD